MITNANFLRPKVSARSGFRLVTAVSTNNYQDFDEQNIIQPICI